MFYKIVWNFLQNCLNSLAKFFIFLKITIYFWNSLKLFPQNFLMIFTGFLNFFLQMSFTSFPKRFLIMFCKIFYSFLKFLQNMTIFSKRHLSMQKSIWRYVYILKGKNELFHIKMSWFWGNLAKMAQKSKILNFFCFYVEQLLVKSSSPILH